MALKQLLMAGLLALVSSAAMAGEAHICQSAGTDLADNKATRLTDKTVFNCPEIGAKTLPELAKLGWKVVQIQQQAEDMVSNRLLPGSATK